MLEGDDLDKASVETAYYTSGLSGWSLHNNEDDELIIGHTLTLLQASYFFLMLNVFSKFNIVPLLSI
jgi:hypothetical protein